MNVFDLFATLSLDKSEYEANLDDAQKEAEGFGSKLKSSLSTAGKVAGGAIAAVGTASAALGKAFVDGMGDVAAYGDTIDKESQKLGISAEAYQEWDAILQHTGGSVDNLKPALKTLSKEIVNNSDAFKQLGISQDDLLNTSIEDVLSTTITKLQEMEPSVERTRLATQLLGRSSVELGALLNTSAEDTEAMRQRVHELGGVMSDEAVKSAAQYQDSLQDMQTALSGLQNNMMSEFLPAASQVMDGLAKVFGGDESGLDTIGKGIDDMITSITDSLPKLMEVGGEIVESLSKSIISNLPKIAKTAGDIILTLASDLVKQLPNLIESGVQIIMELALAIGEALPDLIPTIVDVVLQITNALIDNVDLIVDGAIALVVGLAEGIINALPILIEKAPEIIFNLTVAIIKAAPKILTAAAELIIVLIRGIIQSGAKLAEVGKQIIDFVRGGFMDYIDNAKSWGSDMIQNFINGVLSKWNDLKNAVSDVAQTVKDFLGFSEPKKGPLSNFHTYAPDMVNLFVKGLEDNADKIQDALTSTFTLESATIPSSVIPTSSTNDINASAANNIYGALPVNVNVVLEGDAGKLFTVIKDQNDVYTKANGVSAFAY